MKNAIKFNDIEKFLKIKLKQIVELCIKDSERFKNKNYKIFPYIPNSSFNKEIKDLCEKLGFDDGLKYRLILRNWLFKSSPLIIS